VLARAHREPVNCPARGGVAGSPRGYERDMPWIELAARPAGGRP
jgi:hypothetical protein